MEKQNKQTKWVVLLSAGFVIMTILAYVNGSQRVALQNKLANADTAITETSNTNSMAQQQCIQQARNVAAAAPTLVSTPDNLSASIVACQAQYPTQ